MTLKNYIIPYSKNKLINERHNLTDRFNAIIEEELMKSCERVLINEYELLKESRNFNYNSYKNYIESTRMENIYDKYPGIKKNLQNNKSKLSNLLESIINSFNEDFEQLNKQNFVPNNLTELTNIEIGVGDYHNGKSTAILILGDNKLVYKPTDNGITKAYHNLLDKLNTKLCLKNKIYKTFNKIDYHWLEFVNNRECNSNEELSQYYQRAGQLLCLIYILNGSDFHHENIIASGSSPIMIDHETIIQPLLSEELDFFFKSVWYDVKLKDSVIMTFLLPNRGYFDSNMTSGMCGFGFQKQTKINTIIKQSKFHQTDNWKMVTKFITKELVLQNIPIMHSKPFHLNEFLNDFISGFEDCYYNILFNKKSLVDISSFEDLKIRFIWRSTSIYGKILNQLKLPNNLKYIDSCEKKLRNYLAVAYKNVPKDSNLWWIYEHEVAQMLRGDIPYFEVNSSSRDLVTEFGTIKDFFELSAVENIERKLHKLSPEDMETQIQIIKNCYS